MLGRSFLLLLLFAALSSCSSGNNSVEGKFLSIQYTAAAAPWLEVANDCSGKQVLRTEQLSVDMLDLQTSDFALRLGEPSSFSGKAYQVGVEIIQVVTHPDNPVPSLSPDTVKAVFMGLFPTWKELSGQDDLIQVWVNPLEDDLQQEFSRLIMAGSPVTSNAGLAASFETMADAVTNDRAAIGLLPAGYSVDSPNVIYTLPDVPVLALTSAAVDQAVLEIISCMQAGEK